MRSPKEIIKEKKNENENPGPAHYYKEYVTANLAHKPSVKLGNKTKKFFFNETQTPGVGSYFIPRHFDQNPNN
jgi:hypothetical protein